MNRMMLLETNGHYYYQTLPDALDVFAVLVSFLTTTALLCLAVSLIMMLLRRPRQAFWALLICLTVCAGGYYFISYVLGIKGVLSIATNPGGDVPLESSMKTLAFGLLVFIAALVLNRVNRPLRKA